MDGQSMSTLLRVAEDRRRWAAVTAVWIPQRRLGVTGFDWLIDWTWLEAPKILTYLWVKKLPGIIENVCANLQLDGTNSGGCSDWQQEAHQLVGQAKRSAKIRPKAVGRGIFVNFSNFDKRRQEVADDVISGLAVG